MTNTQSSNRDDKKAEEIKIRAERRAGEMLQEMPKNPGVQMAGKDDIGGPILRPPNNTPSLSDLGITKTQSSNWQGERTAGYKNRFTSRKFT